MSVTRLARALKMSANFQELASPEFMKPVHIVPPMIVMRPLKEPETVKADAGGQ